MFIVCQLLRFTKEQSAVTKCIDRLSLQDRCVKIENVGTKIMYGSIIIFKLRVGYQVDNCYQLEIIASTYIFIGPKKVLIERT